MLIYTTLFSHSRVLTTLLVLWGHSQKIRYMHVPQALVHLVFLNVCVWYLFVSLSVLWVRAAHQSICGGLVLRCNSVKFVNKQKCGPVHGFSVPCRIPKQETDKRGRKYPFCPQTPAHEVLFGSDNVPLSLQYIFVGGF